MRTPNSAAQREHTLDLDRRVAGTQRQRAGHFGARAQAAAVDEAARRAAGHAVIGLQAQEAELGGLLGMGGDEGALALAAHQQVLGRQLVDRLAHRALADLEARGQFGLARDRLAGAPQAGLQLARHQRLDLPVQRAERRRGGVGDGGGGHGPIAAQAGQLVHTLLTDVL
jgi:hypothetical protein